MNFTRLITLVQIAIAATLCVAILVRGRQRDFGLFFAYSIYSCTATIIRFVVLAEGALYFKVYWLTEAIDVILALSVVVTAFTSSFKGLLRLRSYRMLLPSIAAVVTIYCAVKAWAHPPVDAVTVIHWIVGVQIAVQYFMIAAFFAYAALRKRLGISYFDFRYSVAMGFATGSVGMLVSMLFRSEFGTRFPLVIAWAPSVAYFIASCIWIVSSFTPLADEGPSASSISAASALDTLQQYSSTLKNIRK
jgi:hypothetical protein